MKSLAKIICQRAIDIIHSRQLGERRGGDRLTNRNGGTPTTDNTKTHPPAGAHVTGKKRTGMGAGGWRDASAEELAALLRQTVADFSAYVRAVPGDVWAQGESSFGLFRDMSPHDWLFLVAVHSAMHLNQIRRMKAMRDFPAARLHP